MSNFATALWSYCDFRSQHTALLGLLEGAANSLRKTAAVENADYIVGLLLGLQGRVKSSLWFHQKGKTLAEEAIAILEPYGNTEALTVRRHFPNAF